MNYFVYVDDLIGIKTNLRKFRWSFGSCAPKSDQQSFSKCKIKIDLEVRRDSEVFKDTNIPSDVGRFRHFYAKANEKTIYYNQKILNLFELNYYISIDNYCIKMVVGQSYYNFVKYKIMKLHPVWYILFDIVTALLLLDGYLPLYCSSVSLFKNEATVMMAPPNTGKSYTALKLCNENKGKLVCEDLAITDGRVILSVPWTNSYRKYKNAKFTKPSCNTRECYSISNVFVLELGRQFGFVQNVDTLSRITILNHYLVDYLNSPVVNVIAYFNDEFSLCNMLKNERNILSKISENCDCIQVETTDTFSNIILEKTAFNK